MESLIAVESLGKRYGARVALSGVSLSVGAGEIVGLLGPNGAGKTTTLSILATLLTADEGNVRVAGHRLPAEAAAARRLIGVVPQQTAVYPTLTARENLYFFGRMQGLNGRAADRAAAWALSFTALEGRADEPVASFSGGMRRRLNLACGILHRPRVVLLDEPTVGVDPQSRERIFEAVTELAGDGAAVLYSTHYMEEAERLCARVVLLDAGRMIAAAPTAELVARSGMTPIVHLRVRSPLAEGWLGPLDGVRLLEQRGSEISVGVADPSAVGAVLRAATLAGAEILELRLHTPNLADVFFKLTGRALRDEGETTA